MHQGGLKVATCVKVNGSVANRIAGAISYPLGDGPRGTLRPDLRLHPDSRLSAAVCSAAAGQVTREADPLGVSSNER